MEQRYGTDPSRTYGTGVWNGGMERVWSRSLFRTSYFDLPPYVYIYIYAYIYNHTQHIMLYIYTYAYEVLRNKCVQDDDQQGIYDLNPGLWFQPQSET